MEIIHLICETAAFLFTGWLIYRIMEELTYLRQRVTFLEQENRRRAIKERKEI
jgi:hypothetical protein